MRTILFILLIAISSTSFAQNEKGVLVLGNYNSLCLDDSIFVTADSLPPQIQGYSAVMLFSTSTSNLSPSDIEKLTDYIDQGGGLYSGSDNWPFQSESNQITQRLYKKESYGNFKESNAQCDSAIDGNLQLEEMENVPAGKTTVAFPLDYRLKVEAWINDQPLILTGVLGKGRIIIDGGYSRFYCSLRTTESDEMLQKFLDYLSGH